MNAYEIHITATQTPARSVYRTTLLGDHAAVRRAHSLAQDGDLIEIWRGSNCVYAAVSRIAMAQ